MTGAAPLTERLAPMPDPLEAYARVSGLPLPIFLDSAERGPRGRYSFVAADPVVMIRVRSGRTERRARGGGWTPVTGDALEAVARELDPWRVAPVPGIPPFQGGAAGYIGYEWGATLERVPVATHDDLALPDLLLGVYAWVLAWDHLEGAAWIVATGIGGGDPGRTVREVGARLAGAACPDPPPADQRPSRPSVATCDVTALAPSRARSTFTPEGYRAAVARVREYIRAGDLFQANISQRFSVPVAGSTLAAYGRLRSRHPAPFGALIETEDFAVLSASPERFLAVDAGRVETRPIKGTRPRGSDAGEDAVLAAELGASAKDRAENVMIVDLLRNDLSRVCVPASIRVTELCALETHPTVHHLVSTITADLAPGATAADLVRASFPGGSITGAPKIRAMEIIAELEPTRRGVYCGAIGYFSVTGAMDTSIAIRTAVVRRGTAWVAAGGGITLDSDPAAEYDETIAKVRGLLAALEDR